MRVLLAHECRPSALLLLGPGCCLIVCLCPQRRTQSTTDEHFRFHAFATLAVVLDRIRFQQQAAVAVLQEAGERGATGAAAPPLLADWRREQLLLLLWQGFEVRAVDRRITAGCLHACLALQPRGLAKTNRSLPRRRIRPPTTDRRP